MGKVVRVGSRGTSRRVVEKQADDWTGTAYRDLQKKRKEVAGDRYISMGRGTSRIKFSDIAETSGRTSGKGMWVSTGRGTGRRKIK
ncbi:MAG: hypothetical protein NPMRTHETA2_1430002 [Nitrosopumilales archaeon]|nr:MAG: hypothetical protein NPMRTHETA2_1430002 [Nitrosopumilales archaeon]